MAGKKTGKRLLTWVLVLVMALSLLPLNVLADELDMAGDPDTSRTQSTEENDAHLVKSATKDGNTYQIQLESWVTGKVEPTTGSAPLDIVLVLDQSGSMDGAKLRKLKAAVSDFVQTIKADANKHDVVHRIAIVGFASNQTEGGSNWGEDGAWYNTGIFVNGKLKNYETYQGQGQWEDVYLTSKSRPEEGYEYSAYVNPYDYYRTDIEYNEEKQEWGYWDSRWFEWTWTKITPKTDANDDNPDHIQVQRRVKAGYIPLTADDYRAALVDSDRQDITEAIDNLSASGATRASYGMEMANKVFANNELRKGSSRVVVFFTDGEPGQDGYDTNEAGRAIAQAHATKHTYDAKVFSVGMFNKDPSDEVKNFMNYVSSNYPNANADAPSSYWEHWTITSGTKDADKYYMTVENDNLSDVFQTISGSILKPGVTANADTVLTDTLSKFFDFDGVTVENGTVTGGVTVKKVAYQGNDKWAENGTDITSSVDVGLNGKTVTVSGFDYSDEKNVVTDGTNGTNSSGYKLVVTFNVKPDTSYTNWGASDKYPTNDDTATLANGNDTFATVASPKAPVDTYQVTYKPGTGTGNEYIDQYYLNGAKTKVLENHFAAQEGYEFDCWKDESGKTYQVNDPITFNKSDVTLTAQWREIEAPEPSKEDIKELLDDNAVQIICTNDESGHGSKTFGLIDDTFSIVHSGYNCEVKIDSFNEYVEKFNTELDVAQGTHISDASKTSKEQSIINLKWKDGAWTAVDAPAKHHVLCVTPKYTVTYTDGVDGEEVFADQVHNDLLSGTATPAFNGGKPTRNGYVFAGWNPAVARTVTGNATYVAQWTARTDLSYTVHYYLKNTTKKVADDKTVDGQTFNADVTENAIRISGYRVYGDSEKSITIGTGTNEIIFYYTRASRPSTPSKPTLNTGDHYAYVMGYPDGTVRPNGSITRAEVSAILFRLLSDKTRDEYFTTESSFTDVKAGAWYNNSIATLEKAGVIVDTAKGGAFRPNEAITRAELAAMLAQFSDAKPVKGVKFSDVSAEHWAYEAIAIAAKMGWIEGYPDGTFRPDATITRAEMMTLVNRALERVPSDEDHLLSKRVMLTFPDCKSGDWFYIAVQEATNSHTYERAATEKNGDEQWTALRANRDWTLLEK